MTSHVLNVLNVLILGGTSAGRQLAELLALDERYASVVSFAGRTRELRLPETPHRIGGFGGVSGLASHLRERRVDALVDATHPFAVQISENAVRAAQLTGTPLMRLARSAWQRHPDDRWREVDDMAAAAAALGVQPRQVFLSIGRLEIAAFRVAPQHAYLIRAVDVFEPPLPRARVLAARGPFELAAERALLESEGIEVIVSKNSGTDATYAKIVAARLLGLPVIMLRQPTLAPAPEARSLAELRAWLSTLAPLAHQNPSSMCRGQ
jgi:precorrin-6A/cobalt-precorrin-6A reductase